MQTLPELPGCSAGTAGQASPAQRAARGAEMGQDVQSAPQGSALAGFAVWLRVPGTWTAQPRCRLEQKDVGELEDGPPIWSRGKVSLGLSAMTSVSPSVFSCIKGSYFTVSSTVKTPARALSP